MTNALAAAAFWPTKRTRLARDAALAVGGSLALALSAKPPVPFYPVPSTLQTLVVLMLGAAPGQAAIFALGLGWLAVLIGPTKAFALGVAPFRLATIVKTLLASALAGALRGAGGARGV